MADGWLLDITEDRNGRDVLLWLKDGDIGRVAPRRAEFRPPFLVEGPAAELRSLAERLSGQRDVLSVAPVLLAPSLFDRRRHRVLSVVASHNAGRRRVAESIDALGDHHRFTLYDVDLSVPQLYHLTHGLYPFAPVRSDGGELTATVPADTIDYPAPPLRTAGLEVRLTDHVRGRLAPEDGTIASVTIGDARIEGEERDVLLELQRELDRQDPDLLLTDGGDAFDLPWIGRRARAHGIPEEALHLGRLPAPTSPVRPARTYVSYGVVHHRDASFLFPGRFHIDRSNSFLYEDAEVEGLVDAARLSRLSLQSVVRQSPGTCFTAMEMATAFSDGVHVPFHKNRPEEWKSARALVAADRGGVILQPPVGVHGEVEEFDFTSLFPFLMVRHNLSTETLDCRCCPNSPRVVPGLGYRSCQRRVGLIPRTLTLLLERRVAYKARLKDVRLPEEERRRWKHRAKMLKWVLVTAFGYQGYRNARFGRIECHEAINAYARALIGDLIGFAEARGYRALHSLVDSLWLVPVDRPNRPDPEAFAAEASRRFDLPLGYEGRYRWIVFLRAVTHGFGVPNRYYGRYESGEFKLRGIGSRRHDTPMLFRRFEGEVLELLGRAKSAPEVEASVPRLLARADLFAGEIAKGHWPREELLYTHRLSQAPEEYSVFTDSVAALRQLASAGVHRGPGESVRFLVRDRRARSWRDRVTVAELLSDDGPYDAGAYLDELARSAETLLGPLGVDRAMLQERWRSTGPVERHRYRSPESLHQRRIEATADGA
jgi:DNA polymerase-2